MATIKLVIEFPGLTVADLRALVVARDFSDDESDPPEPIAPEHVRGEHVIDVMSHDIDVHNLAMFIVDTMED